MYQVQTTDALAVDSRRYRWQWACGGFAMASIGFIILYSSTITSLTHVWMHTGVFQYAILIFPISAWLVWLRLHDLTRNYNPRICLAAIPLLIGTVFCWLLGSISQVNLLEHIGFVATFPVLVLLFFGPSVVRTLAFPLAYLILAIPADWWLSLIRPLQDITAAIAVTLLEWTGVPVLLEGQHILTPWMDAHVAEACSGVKFLVACTALGLLFSYLMFNSLRRRIAFTFAAICVPILANGLRVYFTILIGGTFGVQYAHGVDHMIFGWQFFGLVLVLLLTAGWLFRQPAASRDVVNEVPELGINWRGTVLAAIAALLIVASGPVFLAAIRNKSLPRHPRVAVLGVSGWSVLPHSTSNWEPNFIRPDFRMREAYGDNAARVQLFVASYLGQNDKDHDLLALKNQLFNSDMWIGTPADGIHVFVSHDGRRVEMRQLVLHGRSYNRLIWYWYRINERQFANPVIVRAWQAWMLLRNIPLRSSVIAVSTTFDKDELEDAQMTLTKFVTALRPQLVSFPKVIGREGDTASCKGLDNCPSASDEGR